MFYRTIKLDPGSDINFLGIFSLNTVPDIRFLGGWGKHPLNNLLEPSRRNVERQNIGSRDTTHDVSPDGQQGLGREQVLDSVLGIGLCDLNLGDHELDLLLADAAQVPVGGREQSGWESVMRMCYEIVTHITHLTSVL